MMILVYFRWLINKLNNQFNNYRHNSLNLLYKRQMKLLPWQILI